MVVQQSENNNGGIFYVAGEQESHLAELAYSCQSNAITIEHTEVAESLRGQNVGYQLVKAAADFARKNSLKIVPVCAYANAVLHKKQEFSDLL